MAREAFDDRRVIDVLKPLNPAIVNAGAQPEQLAKYRVDTWPVVLLIGPDGGELERRTGYISTGALLRWIREGVAGRGEFARAKRARDAAPGDPLALAEYGRLAGARGRPDAGAALEHALALDFDNALGGGEIALARLAERAEAAGDRHKAADLRRRLRIVARDPGNFESAMLGLALDAFAGSGEAEAAGFDRGMKLLDELIRRHPERFMAYYYRASRRIKAGGDRALAIRDAETAAELAPGEHFLLAYAAKLHAEGGNYSNAVKWQRRAVKAHPWAPKYQEVLREYEAKLRPPGKARDRPG